MGEYQNGAQYKTSDIQMAAVLMCLQHPLEDILRRGKFGKRARAVFCFQRNPELERHLLDYENDDVELPPRKLLGRLRDLKAQACAVC